MDLGLKDKHVVVTGGSSGIGSEIVKAFALEGAKVWFCGRSQLRIDRAYGYLNNLKAQVHGQSVDVNDLENFSKWINLIPSIDIFIPNVSALSDKWSDVLQTDIWATQQCIDLVLPKLVQSPIAALTYIGSKASSTTVNNANAYGAGKAALAHYMKSLSLTYAPGLRVNTVSPGDTFIKNGLWGKCKNDNPKLFQQVLDRNPMGRLANPDEIAKVVTFISSPAASFVSGANWYVDGASTNNIQY
ncbi:SDR family oxidoreductase [Photobacterium frigidiphilum]|uniref:SDR family NAD(P)-dependent oxidoreductase n=1 Tax=Photobacterium frigidiphilum TaxID=264736 RepID=UPI003D0ADBB7